MALKYSLSIYRCSIHQEFWAISLDNQDERGNGTGTRLTPSKCCGRWNTVKSFRMNKDDLEGMVGECQSILDEMKKAEK